MSFLKKIFSSGEQNINTSKLQLTFGRYTDCNKTDEQIKHWENAVNFFKENKYHESYQEFFKYITDKKLNNVQVEKHDYGFQFNIYQGSKVINGYVDEHTFSAEVAIAKFNEKLSIAVMRKLINLNYILQYCRFALKEDVIYIKFDTKLIDGSPSKLYFGLKELGTKADQQDDALTNEFGNLQPLGIEHIVDAPAKEKEVKIKYLKQWIDEVIKRCSELDEDRFSGAISYLLLNVCYKIDYLLKPEGKIMQDIERITFMYFQKDNKSYVEKNRAIIEGLQKIAALEHAEMEKCFYYARMTFALVAPASHKQVYEFMLKEFPNVDWYKQNKYEDIAIAIYEYIAGYCHFNFGLIQPTINLLHHLYEIVNPVYFAELGIKNNFITNGKLNKNAIEKQMQEIIKQHQKQYPKLKLVYQNIKYTTLTEFLFSFLNEITYLNFSK